MAIIKQTKKQIAMEDWVAQADKLYVEQGGSSNKKVSRHNVAGVLKVLEEFGVLKKEDGFVKVIK